MAVTKRKRTKPKKPYPSFPLTAHNNGQWCKKIRGKIHFFGVWANSDAALEHYLAQAADLHAGRSPQEGTVLSGEITVKDICNEYLTHQMHKAGTGDISARWFEDCRRAVTCFARSVGSNRLVEDLGPQDFQRFRSHLVQTGLKAKGSGLGVYALNRNITIIKGIFKYSYEGGYIKHPVRYGKSFDKPKASIIRKNRQATELANGKRLFAVPEIRSLLDVCENPLQAMILLGINGGFGNTDCARLPLSAVDWNQAVIEFYRPKTGIERVVPLWPETAAALRKTLAKRPKPGNEEAGKLVFLTTFGRPWVRDSIHRVNSSDIKKVVPIDAIHQEFDKLIRRLGFKRKGLGFYALRHTFRTWADETRDQHAIHRIMGHAIPGMSGIYVEEIGLDRLRAVTEHVRGKLFGD